MKNACPGCWILSLALMLFLLVPTSGALEFPEPADTITDENRAILDPWTGHWEGRFKVYRPDGSLLTVLDVKQHYRWDGVVQRATFHETDQDGNVTTAEAANYQDAQGRLVCTVVKSNGERSLHLGTWSDGYLFWHADRPGTLESFKERVAVEPVDGEAVQRTYEINGYGIYGKSSFLFAGSYREVFPTD
ncbi:MAG: hypothetical protein AAGA25_10070 [Planctomycetota bacterium]